MSETIETPESTPEAVAASASSTTGPADDVPPHRYTAALAAQLETHWQDWWTEHGTFHAPNPAGPLAEPEGSQRAELVKRPKLYGMDMFPYPSGAGLHVGHPLGYIATDCHTRFKRMTGYNVLHPMGFDAFGLPAEQYAVQTGTHPRKTTEENIGRYRAQLRRLGMAYDERRSFATTDPEYYRWTQWIFLQIFNSWYDTKARKARPVAELEAEFARGARPTPDGRGWRQLTRGEQRRLIDDHRLAYASEVPVNWCPGLGTVLANEEVTAEGRSERGNFPVFRKKLKQWMMRITAYADRLAEDLDGLDWPEPVRLMQRNWIGRSEGAYIGFPVDRPGPTASAVDAGVDATSGATADAAGIRVFTTRPDTVFGATYMVLAPEHDLVDALVPEVWPPGTPLTWTGGHATPADAVAAYRLRASMASDAERTADSREKTGVFVGGHAVNPASGEKIPVFIADYVLAGYGTGAIMAVPGQDQRDWEFAEVFDLPIVRTVQPPDNFDGKAYLGEGPAINSAAAGTSLDGLGVADAKRTIIDWLVAHGHGESAVTYRLRDWLFSRQRYWGEPFPIVWDEEGPVALPDESLPVELPEVDDFSPKTYEPTDEHTAPEPPLGRASEWVDVTLDLGDGPKRYRRESNTMPNWAGSCWYELRYLDPTNSERLVDPENERYWMGPREPGDPGGVDLYVGGVEHAVLHLLYARFWHKVLHDLGHVSSSEPFRKLINQGMIQAYVYRDERGFPVPAAEVTEGSDGHVWQGQPVAKELGKIGKSLKNVVTPEAMCAQYGADTFRVYEMSMGPLEVSRPWETRAVIGSYRFLQRVWRNVVDESSGACRVIEEPADEETRRLLHRVIHAVRGDMEELRHNTAIARLIELNNRLTQVASQPGAPREVAEPLVLMLSPFAPHIAEELWRRLGHQDTLAYVDFPVAEPELLIRETVTYPVQVNGKVRGRVEAPADADTDAVRAAALSDQKVAEFVAGREPRKVIVVPGRMVSIVV